MAIDCQDILNILIDQMRVPQADWIPFLYKERGDQHVQDQFMSCSLHLCWTWTGIWDTDGAVVNIKISETEKKALAALQKTEGKQRWLLLKETGFVCWTRSLQQGNKWQMIKGHMHRERYNGKSWDSRSCWTNLINFYEKVAIRTDGKD